MDSEFSQDKFGYEMPTKKLPKVNFSRIHLLLNPGHNYWQPPKKHYKQINSEMMLNQAKHGEGSKDAAGFRYIITTLASFQANIDRSPSGISSQQPQPLSPWPDSPYYKTEEFLRNTRGIVNDPATLQMFKLRLDPIMKVIDRVDKAFPEHTSIHEQQHDSSHTSATINRDLNNSGVESSAVKSRNLEEMTHHNQVQSRGRGSGRSISTRGRHHPGSQNNSKRPNPTDLSSSSERGSSNQSDDATTPIRRGRTGKRVRFT
jgi:hypothetical protein